MQVCGGAVALLSRRLASPREPFLDCHGASMFCVRCLPACGLFACVLLLAGVRTTSAQDGAAGSSPLQAGRLLEVETKGRITTLKIESTDGKSYEVKVTPTLDFTVVGSGDKGFIKPGMFVTARGVLTQEKVFVQNLTVHLLPKGKRAPSGGIRKAAAQVGESALIHEVAGEITAVGPAEGYPDYTALSLKLPGRNPPVWLEKDFQVRVSSSDPAHASPGSDLEMAMKPLPGGKFTPVGIRVQRETPFNSAELTDDDK